MARRQPFLQFAYDELLGIGFVREVWREEIRERGEWTALLPIWMFVTFVIFCFWIYWPIMIAIWIWNPDEPSDDEPQYDLEFPED